MTRPEAMANEKQKSAHPEDVEEVDEEQEEEDWDTAYIPGMCAKKDYEARNCCTASVPAAQKLMYRHAEAQIRALNVRTWLRA